MTIEDESQNAPKCIKHAAGRKPAHESRAQEIRARLLVWKQTPKSIRSSLRALEAETGVSHQLLSFHLKGLEEWEYKEWYRKAKETAKKEAEGIAARAAAQGRAMTMRERLLAMGYVTMVLGQIEELRQAAKCGPLNRHQVQILKLHARQFPIAQEILRRCRQMTPEEERQARAAEKATMFAAAAVQ